MSKEDLSISEMKKMQFDLYEVNKDKWNDEEFSNAYIEKHNVNMKRNYEADNKGKYNKKTF